jgi:hypothetical protein
MAGTTRTRDGEPAGRAEAEPERRERLAHERALLDEAREDVRKGRVVADADVDAWLYRLAHGETAPLPDAPAITRAK